MTKTRTLDVAEIIRQEREYLELTQEEVSIATGISRSSISKIESGQRKVDAEDLKKLSAVLRVTTDYLLGVARPDSEKDEVSLLARKFGDLSENDQRELIRFADFLSAKRSGQ